MVVLTAIPCTLWTVAQLFGKRLPELGRRGYCPFRTHKRQDKTLAVFRSKTTGEPLYKCHSCDPPYNVGDAVGFYQAMFGIDRKTAWNELRDRGYAVPGLGDAPRPRPERVPKRKLRVPVAGERIERIIPFDQDKWAEWADKERGGCERFAAARSLGVDTLRLSDVVDVSDGLIAFGYRDPLDGTICRAKMRKLDPGSGPKFWIEPRPPKGERGKAAAPLYLAHSLLVPQGLKGWVVITEGEVDALTMKDVGVFNAVSLPDGYASSATVSVDPISVTMAIWLIATDADEEGEMAYQKLRDRAKQLGVHVARVRWQKDGELHKDANAAKMAGWQPSDFRDCLSAAAATWGLSLAGSW